MACSSVFFWLFCGFLFLFFVDLFVSFGFFFFFFWGGGVVLSSLTLFLFSGCLLAFCGLLLTFCHFDPFLCLLVFCCLVVFSMFIFGESFRWIV